LQAYGYGDDNPLNEVDPSGQSPVQQLASQNPAAQLRTAFQHFLGVKVQDWVLDKIIDALKQKGQLDFVEHILGGALLSPVKCGNALTLWFQWLTFEGHYALSPRGVNAYNPTTQTDEYVEYFLYSILKDPYSPSTLPPEQLYVQGSQH
jgi:hypothetical protein